MLVKIALVLMIVWIIGLLIPNSVGAVIYIIPLISIAMIMVSGRRRMLNNPDEY